MDGPAVAMCVERDIMVRARDGIGLATDVYRPEASGPFPVILERTPYDKSAPSRSERTAAAATPRSRAEVAAYFVGHGYAVAYQDCRGRYCSEGRFTKYLSEAEDGFDTLAWLVMQPWCNGRAAPSTDSGSSPVFMPRAITTATPTCRRCTCRAGTTPMPAPQWRTTRASRGQIADRRN